MADFRDGTFTSIKSKSVYTCSIMLLGNDKANLYADKYGAMSGTYCGTAIIAKSIALEDINKHWANIDVSKHRFES